MTDNLVLNMDAYLPLRDVVFNTLREAILRGDLSPGERLMEIQLAQKLGVSRTPIREAIRMLEQEGLAITIPRKGAEVAHMTLKDMEDVLEVREALDELAVNLACKKITPDQIKELRQRSCDFIEATKGTDIKKIASTDEAFHDVIYQITNNQKLITLLNNLRQQIFRYRIEYLKDPAAYPTLIQEHEEIMKGLEAADKVLATNAMHTHLANQAVHVKEIIQRQENK